MTNFRKSILIGRVNELIKKNYDTIKVLGEGAYSVVFLAKHKISQMKRCIKKITKSKFTYGQKESIMNEIAIMKELDHPNILKIIEYYESDRSLYLITEELGGGELFDRIVNE